MLITRGQSKIDLPDDWVQTDEKNPDYYEAADGACGLYITSHTKSDLDGDRKILDFVRKLEKNKTKSMKGYKFRSYVDAVDSSGNAIVGYLDQYAQEKNYRIVSKIVVRQQNIFRAVLHDYDCGDYEKSKRSYDHILESFIYQPKHAWHSSEDDVVVITEEGFVDIDLHVASYNANKDGPFRIRVANTFQGKAVGFLVQIDKKWTAKKMENVKKPLFWGTGQLIFDGEATVAFVEMLSGLYGVSLPTIVGQQVDFDAVGLFNDPRKLATREVKMKLFFNSENQNLYSEVYLNVNLSEKTLELHEKDQDYRQPLVRSLCGET